MIPELYDKQVINNKAVPIAYLTDIVLCEVTEERNGIFELYAEYPSTGNNAELIEREMLIKVKTNDSQNSQYFRIYRIFKSMNGFMQIYAQHISYDLADIVIKPKNFGTVNPENILTQILNNTDFSGFSTYDNAKKFKTTEPRSIRAILGGSEESILRKWHGEYTFDNFDITFTPARGEDKSGDSTYNIEYGKNLSDISFDGDNSGIYTKVMPFAYDENDKLVFLNEKDYPDGLMNVQLPIEGSELGREKILALDVSQLFEEDETVDSESVMQKAEAYITDNIIGVVIPSITVNIEPYTQDEVEYHICDTVKVVYPPFNIDCTAKITRIVYDSILERCKEITVGNIQQSFADSVVSIVDKATQKNKNTVEKVNAITAKLKESVKEATDKITGVTGENGGYVHLIQNEDGTTKEICITNTADIKTAKKVWRWNNAGLGYSSNGYDGTYALAMTNNGEIVADFVKTGSLTANVIKAGTITSTDGHNYWNIESGKIKVDDAIIAGFHVAGNKNPDNGFYKYSLSTIINTEAGVISAEKPQFAVFLRGQSEDATAGARTPNMIVLGVKKRISSADAWSDNTKAPYTFTLAANGSITATSGNIAGWSLSDFSFSKSYKMLESSKSVDYSINLATPIADNLVQPLIYCLRKPGTDATKWEYKFKLNTDGSADFTDLNVTNVNVTGGQFNINDKFIVDTNGICSTVGMTCSSTYVKDDLYIADNLNLKISSASGTSAYGIVLQWGDNAVKFGVVGTVLRLYGSSVVLDQGKLLAPMSDGTNHNMISINSDNELELSDNRAVRVNGHIKLYSGKAIYFNNGTEEQTIASYSNDYMRLSNTNWKTFLRGREIQLGNGADIFSYGHIKVVEGKSICLNDGTQYRIIANYSDGYLYIANSNLKTVLQGTEVRLNSNSDLYLPKGSSLRKYSGSKYSRAISGGSDADNETIAFGDSNTLTSIYGNGINLYDDITISKGKGIFMYADDSTKRYALRWYDNAFNVGMQYKTLRLWGDIVKLNGGDTAVTSDARVKKEIAEIDEKYEEFFKGLKPTKFKYINGTSDRTHIGFIAQEVEEALTESKLTTQDFAGYVRTETDEDDAMNEELDGYELSLRYSEFIALNTQMIQKLMARVDELEKEIKELKG